MNQHELKAYVTSVAQGPFRAMMAFLVSAGRDTSAKGTDRVKGGPQKGFLFFTFGVKGGPCTDLKS